ncbi:MAG: CPBP family intramembrane metalloprotease [Candidatus Bathyarchaeota archaeon]|jgi:membrane protease YdiL (CAAX protease family)
MGAIFLRTKAKDLLAALVFLALWLNGSFYPLILLPPVFVKAIMREELSNIGFRTGKIVRSLVWGLFASLSVLAAYYLVYLSHNGLKIRSVDTWSIFTDALWYPVYEEVAYRGFFLGYFSKESDPLMVRNLVLNITQTLLFTVIHRHHVAAGFPLLLIPVFLLGFLNGFVFLKTQNIAGCVAGHSLVNVVALLMV